MSKYSKEGFNMLLHFNSRASIFLSLAKVSCVEDHLSDDIPVVLTDFISVTPQILGNPELDSWPQFKGLSLRVTLIHVGNQSKHPGFFFFSIKSLILNKFIKLRFTITYHFIFPKLTITLSLVHKY